MGRKTRHLNKPACKYRPDWLNIRAVTAVCRVPFGQKRIMKTIEPLGQLQNYWALDYAILRCRSRNSLFKHKLHQSNSLPKEDGYWLPTNVVPPLYTANLVLKIFVCNLHIPWLTIPKNPHAIFFYFIYDTLEACALWKAHISCPMRLMQRMNRLPSSWNLGKHRIILGQVW